jgi:hypothetical protein
VHGALGEPRGEDRKRAINRVLIRSAVPKVQNFSRRKGVAWSVLGDDGFLGLCESIITLPALVLELDVLNGNGVCVGIKVRKGLVVGYPAPIDLVTEDNLAPTR